MLAVFFFRKYLFSPRAGSLIRVISWISLLGVAMGVLSLIVVVSVMSGFHEVIRNRLLGLEPHVVMTLPTNAAAVRPVTQSVLRQWGGGELTAVDAQDLIVRTLDGIFAGGLARGYEQRDLQTFLKRLAELNRKAMRREQHDEVASSPFVNEATTLRDHEVLLGVDLARSLGVLEGDQVLLIPPEGLLVPRGDVPIYERVTVVGRVSTRVADLDSKLILYDSEKTLKRLSKSPSREKTLEIRLTNAEAAELAKVALKKAVPNARIESWRDRNEALFFALRMEKLVMTVFLGLSGLITSFSIVSVLSLLVSQKRKEIGLLMAMGLTGRKVQRVFLGVGFLLSALGIVVGLSVGLAICALIDRFPISLLPDIYYDSTIPVLVTQDLVVAILGFSFCIALISAFLPARGLSKLTPAETFRLRVS